MNDAQLLDSIMGTARATREFREEPVDRGLLTELVRAATWAPSPRNTQPWEFVVVDDRERIAVIGELIGRRADEVEAMMLSLSDPGKRKMFRSVVRLFRGIGRVPALVFVCGRKMDYGSEYTAHDMVLSATYTAAQNLLLAARARGLGGVFTTLHLHIRPRIDELLELPAELSIEVSIPLGWPATPFAPLRRRPVEEVLHWNRFGGR